MVCFTFLWIFPFSTGIAMYGDDIMPFATEKRNALKLRTWFCDNYLKLPTIAMKFLLTLTKN